MKNQEKNINLIGNLFVKAKLNCQAYKRFLKSENYDFRLSADYKSLPIMDKNNYLNKYSLEEKLYSNQKLDNYYMICSSTGSTGEATIWPRDYESDERAIAYQEKFLNEHFQIDKKKTLIVVMFGLGLSTSGMLTAKLSWGHAKNNKVSVITPGLDIDGAVKLINKIYDFYEQTVIIGYPPLVNELIENAIKNNFKIKKWNIKLALTGENVSFFWKKKILTNISNEKDYSRIVMFYACSEAGILGVETIKTKAILEKCLTNKSLLNDLFLTDGMPTLILVEQSRVFIEVINSEIVISVDQPIPLIRYNIHDRGMLISGSEINEIMKKYNLNLTVENSDVFLCIYGRNQRKKPNDITLTIEEIKNIIEDPEYEKYFTGYFTYSEEEKNIVINLIIKENILISKKLLKNLNNKIFNEINSLISLKNKEINLNLSFEQGKNHYKNGKLAYYE